MITIKTEIGKLNEQLPEYGRLARKTPAEVLLKQGGKLGFALNQRLKGISPAKGQVRAERLAALKRGEGVRVRERVLRKVMEKYQARTSLDSRQVILGKKGETQLPRKGKRLNLQALAVQAELSTRESGRMFLAVSARYPRTLKRQEIARSRFGPLISEAGLVQNDQALRFEWDGSKSELSSSAAAGLSKPKAQRIIALSLRDVSEDVRVYVRRKLDENARKVRLS